jgi:biotin carboxylase
LSDLQVGVVVYSGSWKQNETSSAETLSQSMDIVLEAPTASTAHHPSVEDSAGAYFERAGSKILERFDNHKGSAISFFLDALLDEPRKRRRDHTVLKLILPTHEGFVIQSDFLERRFVDCQHIAKAVGFVTIGQRVHVPQHSASASSSTPDLLTMLNSAVGGIMIKDATGPLIDSKLEFVESQLANRISFKWLAPRCPAERRIALVGGLRNLQRIESVVRAAKSLGIKLVVLDSPDQLVKGQNNLNLSDSQIDLDFLPCDISLTEALSDRILHALQTYPKPIDGIVTYHDELLVPVAKAAVAMGLITEAPSAFELATNKYKTREANMKHSQLYHIAGVSDLEELLRGRRNDLAFPLIVKPRLGFSSRGVYKVRNEHELRGAVARNSSDAITRTSGPEQVIETYMDGPEVDANVILLNGEVLFFEVNDDFPSDADNDSAPAFSCFHETGNLIPSSLPEHELLQLRTKLQQSLLNAGFRSGIFHMEARIIHSRVEYRMIEDGLIDLAPKESPPDEDADIFLLEINARPAGMQETNSISRAYGIDYCVTFLLNAVGDAERMRELSRPFSQGAQYHGEIIYLHAQHGGIFDADDVCVELQQRCPDLTSSIADCCCFLRRGARVEDPQKGIYTFVAYFLVFSRTSRQEALRLGQRIRREVRYTISRDKEDT